MEFDKAGTLCLGCRISEEEEERIQAVVINNHAVAILTAKEHVRGMGEWRAPMSLLPALGCFNRLRGRLDDEGRACWYLTAVSLPWPGLVD